MEFEFKLLIFPTELLRVHIEFRHMSFTKIRFMSALGWIESKLAKCRIPKCAGFLNGKATCKPWQKEPPIAF